MPTIRFPWFPSLTTPGLLITNQTTPAHTQVADSCTEVCPGIYEAVFATLTYPGNQYITPRSGSINQDGVGFVYGVLNTDETFLEEQLIRQSNLVLASLSGVTVEVINPTSSDGSIRIHQGDTYEDDTAVRLTITGSLPLLEEGCILRIELGGSTLEFPGTVIVNSSTSYTLSFDMTGDQSLAIPAGYFSYQMITTYQGTGNEWTPSEGSFEVVGRIIAPEEESP